MKQFLSDMNPWRGLKATPKEIWVIAIATFINRSGTVVVFFLTYYLRQAQFGFSLAKVGFILGLVGIGSLGTAYWSGWLSDRVGALQVMKLSLVLSGAVLLIYPLASRFEIIALLTIAWAITADAFRPASNAILTSFAEDIDETQSQIRARSAQSLNRLAINLGFAVGPLLAGFLATKGYWKALFIIDGATSILAFVYLSVTLRPAKFQSSDTDIHTTESITITGPSPRAIRDRRLLFFLFAIAPTLVVLFMELGPLPQFMKIELGIGEKVFGYLIAFNALLVILFEFPLSWMTRVWSYRRSLSWSALLIGVGFGALAFAHQLPLIVITVAIWTLGEMFLLPNTIAYVSSIAPKPRRGEYIGVYSMVFSVCMSVGPALGVLTLARFGGKILWSMAFMLGVASALMITQLDKRSA